MRRLPFVHVDVFTDRPLTGNGLTVFTDARGLSDGELQALARETRQAETTFIFREPGSDPSRARVRIFTPSQEMPFAGHPTLGTAFVLRSASSREVVTLELNVGPIPVRFEVSPGPAFGEMRQNDPTLGEIVSHEDAARAADLPLDALDPALPVQPSTTGLPFLIVPLRSREVLKTARPTVASMAPLLTRAKTHGLYLVARGEEPGIFLHARMFDLDAEDPATGSAAGACTAWLVKHGVLAPETRAVIGQGDEIFRPSRIHVRAALREGRVTEVRVGGNVVEVARGEVAL